jgi:hypothetical protein
MVGWLAMLRDRQNSGDGAAVTADHQLAFGFHQFGKPTDVGAHVANIELLHQPIAFVLQIILAQHN